MSIIKSQHSKCSASFKIIAKHWKDFNEIHFTSTVLSRLIAELLFSRQSSFCAILRDGWSSSFIHIVVEFWGFVVAVFVFK